MDRNKPGNSRSSKSKVGVPHHGSEIFALGSKSSSRGDETKSKVMSTGASDRKRETASSLSGVPLKKPKLNPSTSKTTETTTTSSSSSTTVVDYWEQIATECETTDIVSSVLTAIEQQDSELVVALICGAIKQLINPRSKPDLMLSLSLLYLAKIRPHLFCNETITSALVSILRRDTQHAFKGRNNQTVHVLAANLLGRGHHDKQQWPEIFLKLYIEDAVNERVWVDYEDCSAFVDNICTAFGTKTPPKSMLQPELTPLNPIVRDLDEESGEGSTSYGGSGTGDLFKSDENRLECPLQMRYAQTTATTEKLVLDTIKEQISRRQTPDCSTRNFLKFLSTTSGLAEVRAMAVTRLELWIHNGKLMKPAQELLTYVCYNISGTCPKDSEVLTNLVKMRLKTKPLINIYMICLKEMVNHNADTLVLLLKLLVTNELSSARNPNNMGMLANIFQAKPIESANSLAEIYQEFLMQREDCLRTLRVFLRELVKMLRYEIKLLHFCKSLITIRPALQQIQNFEFKDRFFCAVVDLISLCSLLSVSPQIKESLGLYRNGRVSEGLFDFFRDMKEIQLDYLTWMHEVVPVVIKPNSQDYAQSLHKLLLMDSPEQYSKIDSWPHDPERTNLLRLASEVPVDQDSILRLILIGITKEIQFSIPDTMEVIEQLIRRAAGFKNAGYPPLEANKLEIIDFLFQMAEYHHPENIVLPTGYEPPKLAISSLYWKAWTILLMLSTHNPSTFGSFCWDQYPNLRNLIEMCITNQFTNIRPQPEELQIITLEKTQILEFETHLAAATSKMVITEQTSLLLSQLMLMDPMGIARKPPNYVLELLQNLNVSHKLGHMLCRSRKPDLLLEIIQKYGTSQSMPWLADLVQNSDGDFNHLPVQCLCEFLLSNANTFSAENRRDAELLDYLQLLVNDSSESGDHQTCYEVLEYFLRRLSASSKTPRLLAIKGLNLLLQNKMEVDEQETDNWSFLRNLELIPNFPYIRLMIIAQLKAACQVENCPELIMRYIQLIAGRTLNDSVADMLEHVMDMSQLIIERSTVFSYLIPTQQDSSEIKVQTLNSLFIMFNYYLAKLREHGEIHAWPEYPDLLMVHFADGTQIPVHLNTIHAFVILMSHSPTVPYFSHIMDHWFPVNASLPQAFSMESSEVVHILPDWLKLKMIRSSNERLVDAALEDLTPDQIVLFIQNFGTPIQSVSKLLALLDRAVIEQFETVKSTILNTAYLAQLIEIQQGRGAKNGHIAVQALELHSQIDEDFDEKVPVVVLEPIGLIVISDSSKEERIVSQTKEIEEVIDRALTTSSLNRLESIKFRKIAQQLICRDFDDRKKFNEIREYTLTKVLKYLYKILKGANCRFYVEKIFDDSKVCCLFRSLLTQKSESVESRDFLNNVLLELIKYIKPQRLLHKILLNKVEKKSIKKIDEKNLIEILEKCKNSEIEKSGKSEINELLKTGNVEFIVKAITGSLKLNKPEDRKGILIDWLAEADSELVSSDQRIQMDLLYSSSLQDFRFYMLSLLSHQTSWETLHQAINQLLLECNGNYDPSSVLDSIQALTSNPKLWQGRDKTSPKHEQVEYIISLDEREMNVLVDYMLNEVNTNLLIKEDRIQLLFQCVNPDWLNFKSLINYVETHKSSEETKIKFLQQLYMNIPSIKFIETNLANVYQANLKGLTGCAVDKIVHYIVTTISSLSSQKDYQNLSQDTELLLRKLAASHPSLFLRQLSVLSSLLQGRAHMDVFVLRGEYHIQLFSQVLGVLELLQPQVFEESYKDGLHSALECFFALLQNHSSLKEVYSIIYRLMDFLQAYTNFNAARALSFIETYTDLLQYLSFNNRHILSLQQLVQGVSLLKHKSENNKIDEQVKNDENSGAAAVILAPYTKFILAPPHWSSLLNTVQSGNNSDEIYPALQEIDSITSKRAGLLDELFEKLINLLFSPSPSVRSISHVLLARHLKHNPGNCFVNSSALTAYVQCLTNKDVGIAISALETLTEIVICLQEFSSEILKTVFELGISSKLNTYSQIKKCVLALKTQHAC